MKKATQLLTSLVCVALCGASAHAANKYWDLNGATAGAGGPSPSGTWNTTSSNWSTDSTGSSATTTIATTDVGIFSAGTDATGEFTVSGTATAAGITVEEGKVVLAGTITIGANPVAVNSGAALSINNSARIAATGGNITISGGTLENTAATTAGNFVDADQKIVLSGGGTLSYTASGLISIIQATTVISGSGPLTKEGDGILAIASPCTYSGSTIINHGTLRVRGPGNNRLPSGTAVIINSPGVFDPVSYSSTQSQQVSSVEGTGNIAFTSSGNLIINQTSGTKTLSGVISDGSYYAKVTKQGAGELVLSGVNTYNGRLTNVVGTVTVTATGSLMDAVGDLYLNSGVVNLNNAAQSIENLIGSGGTLNLNGDGGGHTLTMGLGFDSTYAGTIAGVGGIILNGGAYTLTLSGNNSYSGGTTIGSGKLVGLVGGSCANSAVSVAYAATNAVRVADNTKQWTCGGMTFAAGSYLEFDFGDTTVPSTTVAPLQVNGNVDFSAGQPTVNLIAFALPGVAGDYPLMTWTGSTSGTFTETALSLGAQMTATVRITGKTLELHVTGNKEPLYWATGSGTWDVGTSSNWLNAASESVAYLEPAPPGDQVVFEDTKSGTSPINVALNGIVSPARVTADNSTKDYTISGSGWIQGGAALIKKGSNKLTLAGYYPHTYAGGTRIEDGTLQLGDGTVDCNVAGDISTALTTSTLIVSNLNAQTVGNISGAGKLLKGSAGTLTLTAGTANNFTGGQTIYDGTLYLGNTANMMSGPVLIDGPLAKVSYPSGACIGSTAAGSGDITLDNGGTIENTYVVLGTALVTPNRSIKVGAGGGQINTGGTGPGDTILQYDGGVIAGVTPGTGTLTFNGPGEFRTYNAHNSFGKLIVNGGMFTAGHGTATVYNDSYGAIPATPTADAMTIRNGSQLRLAGGTTVVTLDANQGITMGAGGGIIRAVSGLTLGIPGVISGSGALQIGGMTTDPGTIVLGGANTFSGGVTLYRGTTCVNNAEALGAAASTVTIGTTNAVTLRNTSGGPITLVNNNTQIWNTNFTFSGTSDLNLGTGAVTLNGSLIVTVSANNLTVGGIISGTGFTLSKAGANGTLILTAANTYNGGTTVSAGTLDIQKDGGLGSGNVAVASGATLRLTGGTANTYINPAAILTLEGASPAVKLDFTGAPNTINALYFGTSQMPAGTWGAIGSGATHQSAFFTGTGMLNVTTGSSVVPSTTAAILSLVDKGSGQFDLTLQGTPGAEYQVVASGDVTKAMSTWTPVTGSTFAPDPTGQWTSTVTNPAPQFYRLKAVNPAP